MKSTCPLLVHFEASNKIVPLNTTNIVAGVYVARPPVTNFSAKNNSNTNKKVIYRTFVTNNYPAVSSGGSFNQLINSGIVHPTGVLIVPFLVAVTGSNGGLGDNQWKSPFDTCPGYYFPSIFNQFTSFRRWSKRFTIYSSIWLRTFLRTS